MKHGKSLIPLLNPATEAKSNGISPLYDGNTGQIVWYSYSKKKKNGLPGILAIFRNVYLRRFIRFALIFHPQKNSV